MRFLFVYQNYAVQARKLLDDLGVHDVELIVARRDTVGPATDELALLSAHLGAEAAACELNRKYRKSVEHLVKFCVEPKKFRFEDRQLRDWLVPPNRPAIISDRPSNAFRSAAVRSTGLVLHTEGLDAADDMAEHRWRFANLSADLLARYALGESLGPLREWKSNHGVDFATGGQVSFSYTCTHGDETRSGRTNWHLKSGDHTTRESAARVYFCRIEFSSGPCVVVFYVGPHPAEGERVVSLHVSTPTPPG